MPSSRAPLHSPQHILGVERLGLQSLGELQQNLGHTSARSQLIRSRSVVPFFIALQFQLQPQVRKLELVGAFLLTQTFHLQIMRPLTLLLRSLLLLISFPNQGTENRF